MNRSRVLYWLGFCILVSAAMVSLAVSYSRSTAQGETPTGTSDKQSPAAPLATLFSYQGRLTDAGGVPINNPAVDMLFKIYPTESGGAACWAEDHVGGNAISVQDGEFNVLLGQLNAIELNCISGAAYLELAVNGETLAPREMLTSVAFAVEARTLAESASTASDLTLNGELNLNANPITNVAAGIYADPSSDNLYLANDYGTARIRASSNIYMFLDSNNNSSAAYLSVYKDSTALNEAYDEIMRLSESGDMSIDGTLNAGANVVVGNNLDLTNGNLNHVGTINYSNGVVIAQSVNAMRMISDGASFRVFLDANNDEQGESFQIYRDAPNFSGGLKQTLNIGPNGEISWPETSGGIDDDLSVSGNIFLNDWLTSPANTDISIDPGAGTPNTIFLYDNVVIRGGCRQESSLSPNGTAVQLVSDDENCGSGSLTSGAYIEANLMTADERLTDSITRFEIGDLLCWSAELQQLELCATENDRLVMAVANKDGKPVVLGAEPIKVIGPVSAGDLLVASGTPGYARANNNPIPGTVIGQTLENLQGVHGTVKAMIRKW